MGRTGANPGFQVRGGTLRKIAPGGGRREHCWGISCEKSRFYAKKSNFFHFRGARAGCAPPGSAPGLCILSICILLLSWTLGLLWCHIYRISYVMWYFQCILSVCILLLSLTLGLLWCQHIYRIFSASYPFVSYYVG
jgi:hypothetical protein